MTRGDGKIPARAGQRVRRARRPLLTTSALIALTAFGLDTAARAQSAAAAVAPSAMPSYLGTVQSAVNATVTNPTDGRTNIQITNGAANAIIDWTPPAITPASGTTPAQIVFQQATTDLGNPSRAVVTSTGQSYTLLNRINGPVGVPVLLNGVTTSYVGGEFTATGAPGQIGGAVWFYSPGGLIVGASGAFNVGALLLTANQIAVGGTAQSPVFVDGTGKISFTGATDPTASVVIQRGAQLNLQQAGAYLAVVAPHVTMDGTATVNGSAAYVAAETVDITMHDRLFDIAVSQGSDAPSATDSRTLKHTGTTTGPAPQQGEARAVYMVAVPKNTAVTMLVSGRAGYQGDATSATAQNGIVVLSAGNSVRTSAESGYGVATAFFDAPPAGSQPASIRIEGSAFSSRVFANATQDIVAATVLSDVTGSSNISLAGNSFFTGRRTVAFGASGGATIAAAGDLGLTASGAPAGQPLIAPTASLDAGTGASATVAGALTMTASNTTSDTPLVHLGTSGGSVTVSGVATLDASGSSQTGAAVRGGTVEVVSTSGAVAFNGGLQANAGATAAAAGATATGGTVRLAATDGSISTIFGSLSADAFAGDGALGTGGTVSVALGGTGTPPAGVERRVSLGSFADLGASGYGGTGGAGRGGTVSLNAASGTIDGSTVQLTARGYGGRGTAATSATANNGGIGARGDGGTATVTLTGGSTDFEQLGIDASGFGGTGGRLESGYGILSNTGGGAGGVGQGGTALVDIAGGLLGANSLDVSAEGRGGDATGSYVGTAARGGDARGGTATVRANATGAQFTGESLSVSAVARGGLGGFGINVAAGTGGRADGGTARLLAENRGSVGAGFAEISASAYGGGFDGAEGQGRPGLFGTGQAGLSEALFRAAGAGQFDTLLVEAAGLFGGPRIGGTANVLVAGGTLGVTTQLLVDTSAPLGSSVSDLTALAVPAAPTPAGPYDAGGGAATLSVSAGSTLTLGASSTLTVRADAASGADSNGTVSGNAIGGTASARFEGVTQAIPSALTITAAATSGDATTPGRAYGGNAALAVVNGAAVTLTGTSAITAAASTGRGTIASAAFGGTAGLLVDAGQLTTSNALTIDARGIGNDSADAGAASDGTGGTAMLTLATGGTIDTPQLSLLASGTGGANPRQSSGTTPPRGRAGNAQGGNVLLSAASGRLTVAGATVLDARGTGGATSTSGTAGDAVGGTVGITAGTAGNTVLALQGFDVSAVGDGGAVVASGYGAGGDGGDGRGGSITAALGAGSTTATTVSLDVRGTGRNGGSVSSGVGGGPYDGGTGGAGVGGRASLLTAGTFQADQVKVQASAIGGNGGNPIDGSTGRVGNGGGADGANALAEFGGAGQISASQVALDAGATGGNVGISSTAGPSAIGVAGVATGGVARLVGGDAASTGTLRTITVPTVQINARATGGSASGFTAANTGNGAAGTGGIAQVSGRSAFAIANLSLDARGIGGGSAAASGAGQGGAGVLAVAGGGTLDVSQTFTMSTRGTSNTAGAAGGAGRGGSATLSATGTGSRITIVPVTALDTSGIGGTPGNGAGGAGAGGTITVAANGGTINLAPGSTLVSSGTGADATSNAAGGAGAGGAINVTAAAGGLVNVPVSTSGLSGLSLTANGTGGTGSSGGAAAGGAISLALTSGRVTVGNALAVSANASGGSARNGDGGAAQGGTVSIALASSDPAQTTALTSNGLSLGTTAFGGSALAFSTSQTNGRNGGAAVGGNVTLTVASGSVATRSTQISAGGTGGNAYGGAAGQAGTGGRGTGGNVTITSGASETGYGVPAATIDFTGLTVTASGFGGGFVDTGYGLPAEGADGGAGQGGAIVVVANGGRMTTGGVFLGADGTGSAGQASGGAIGGGNGGAGFGGSVIVGSGGGQFTSTSLFATATGAGRAGATGSSGGSGGGGGGGSVTLRADRAAPSFGGTTLLAGAVAGGGAAGRTGAGGAGGAAAGGRATLTSTGAGGALILPGQLQVNVNATGGTGGAGGNSTRGGAGGAGGAAFGGGIFLTATDGGQIANAPAFTQTRTFAANATGGNGAAGGNGSNFGDAGGIGGDGGAGQGGGFELTATGGTISLGSLRAEAIGTGGNSAAGGSGATQPGMPGSPGNPDANPPVPPTPPVPAIPAVTASSGNAGGGYGGFISIRAADLAQAPAGGISIGDASLIAIGNGGTFPEGYANTAYAGRIEILNDRSVADGGTIGFGQVTATAVGQPQELSGISILAGRGDVTFAGFDGQAGGPGTLRAVDAAAIVAQNNFNLFASDSITVDHDRGDGGATDTLRAATIFLNTGRSIFANSGSVLRASDTITLRADDSIFGAALFARNAVSATAGFDVTLGDVIADAPAFDDDGAVGGGRIDVLAGQPAFVSSATSDALNSGSVTVAGRFFATAATTITAGRDVTVNDGASVESDNLVRIDAGNDVIVRAGGSIVAATDPLDASDPAFESAVGSAGVVITAGRQAINYTPDDGNVASILIGGTLSAGERAVSLTAGAVEARANPIVARSLIVSIDGAPATSAGASDDGGLLSADCTRGSVCLGAIRTSRTLLIGGLSGTAALPTRVSFSGSFDDAQSVVRAYGPITLGGSATYNGSDLLRIQSLNGLVTLGSSAVLTGGSGGGQFGGLFDILAATGIAGTGATLDSAGDVRLFAGSGDLALGTLRAAGVVTTLAADGSVAQQGRLNVIGAVQIGNLLVSGGDAIVTAGRNLTIGTAAVANGRSIALTAGGALALTAAGGLTGQLPADITLAGTSINLGTAAGTGTLAATSSLGDIVVQTATVGAISLRSAGNVAATGALNAAGSVDINAVAGAANLAAIAAGGSVTLNAGAGPITGTTVRAGVNPDGTVIAGSTADIAATASGAITFDRLAAARNVALNAGGAVLVRTDLAAGGLVTARGTTVSLTATGPLAVDAVTATNGSVTLNGGDVRLRTASATGDLTVRATGLLDVATALDIGGGIDLSGAGAVTTQSLRAGRSVIVASSGATLAIGDVESVGGVARASAAGNLTAGNIRAAGSIYLTGRAAVTAGNLTAGTGPLAPGAGGTTPSGGGGIDPSIAGIAPGFDDFTLARNDDGFTGAIMLPFAVNYFGRTYTSTYVSNNGYLTFNTGQGTFTPGGLGAGYSGQPIIAAFFADVDTRNSGSALVAYGPGTFAGREAFGATYDRVGYFASQADKLNSFQIVLTNRADTGAGNFDIYYNYTAIKWETGSASSGVNGFGGISAGVGYNAGTGNQAGTFFELPGSRVPGSFLDSGTAPLVRGTNNGIPGQLLFSVRNGQVVAPVTAEPATVHVTNLAAGNTAAIALGNISAEAAEVHGAGTVTIGNVDVGDRGSGIAGTGNRYATVVDAAGTVNAGNLASTGYVVLGSRNADIMASDITTASSATVLAGGTVVLGAVTTGRGANDSLFVSNSSILTGNSALAGFDYTTLLTSTRFGPASFSALTPVRLGGNLTLRGALSTGSLAAAAQRIDLGTLAIDAAGRIYLDSAAALAATTLTAGGDITLNSDGTLTIGTAAAGGMLRGTSLGALTATSVTAGTGVTLAAGGALGVDSATATSGDVALTGGTLRVGRAQAGRDILLTAGSLATNEGTHASTAANLTAGRNIVATIDGTLALTTAAAGGTLTARTSRDLTADALTAAGALTLRSFAGLTVGSAASTGTGGTVDLASGAPVSGTAYSLAGNTIVNGTVSGTQAVTINGGGDVTINGSVRGPTLTIASGDDITVAQAGSLGTTGSAVSLTAGSLRAGAAGTDPAAIVINGTIDGATIALASEAIDLGTAARVGSAATSALTLTNRGTSRTFIGGAGDGAVYALSNAEVARLRAGAIRIVAPAVGTDAATPDAVIQTLDLVGSAATANNNLFGNNASFTVQSAGTLRVDGAVGLTAAAATDTLALSATRRIDVNAATGSLAVTNAGALAGRLTLAADTIFAGTTQAAADVAAAATTDARDQRLGQAEAARPDGYLRANGIEFRFGSGLFVQNAGTVGDTGSTTRTGFSAGSGGVTLIASPTTTTTANPVVVINGRVVDTAGATVTGVSVIPRLTIRGSQTTQTPTLDPRSTVNGCLIVGQSCRFDVVASPPVPIDNTPFPVQDTIREALEPRPGEGDPTEGGVTRVNAPLIDLPDFVNYGVDPTIDEPVTGAGNDDLLVGDPDECPPGATDPRCTGAGQTPTTRP